ncbi:hypothetical protein [Candidatus Parabeggiatoa sp. HSG14]|uniref:hypothetical protein n=1 Tax=Candidatus Parabeggiatoa sp. HSG14 TaxID=3055593 RepID=UPI0025A78774|nr:hypothetical protein [Thiotrichales bacterium HSG14]
MEIEFLQSQQQRNIKEKLEQSINECVSLKGAVAFWKLDTDYLKGLADKLSHNDSYVCVDIHQPTDIDCLKKFVEKDSNIYLFLYRVETGRHPLLHTKLLLFDFPDGKAEIWIGSQNFTRSALEGFNLESTSIITTTKGSPLYKDIISYLDFIKACCEDIGTKVYPEIGGQFNLKFLDFYKKLQHSFDFQEKNYQVIDLVCEDVKDICSIAEHKNNSILIASFINENDSSKFPVGKEILIRALDKEGETICYKSNVLSVAGISPIEGSQESEEVLATTYTDRHGTHYKIESYIVRDKDKIPVFISSRPYNITNQLVSVIIRIAEEFNKDLYSSKKGDFWKKVSNDDKSKELTYLKSITSEEVQVPKSPETVKRESTYPFDKIRDIPPSERKAVIEQLYKLVLEQNQKSECQSTNQKKLEKPFLKITQKQSIARKMVAKKEEDNTDKKLENKTTDKSKNNEDSQQRLNI